MTTLIRNKEIANTYGSGSKYYHERINVFSKNELYKTSRFYYMVFCDTLVESKDNMSGGAPQLIGLYRGKNNPVDIGTIWNNKRYLYGLEVESAYNIEMIEWRNENFERYEVKSNRIVKGAQRQPRPKDMKKPPWY